MHVAAEMSGAGGSWYPEQQHASPVPVRGDEEIGRKTPDACSSTLYMHATLCPEVVRSD